jgi:hypothetical protein
MFRFFDCLVSTKKKYCACGGECDYCFGSFVNNVQALYFICDNNRWKMYS